MDLAVPCDEYHEAFLERAAQAEGTSSSTIALGAFLTMRLMDQFATDRTDRSPTALHYQISSTREFLAATEPQTEEVEQLRAVVQTAEEAAHTGRKNEVHQQLLAYAKWLESELQFAEARDVLVTALRLAGAGAEPLRISTLLQLGRVLRHLGQFEASRAAYRRGGELASAIGDNHSELLSRIGQGVVFQKTGNLPESERVLRGVLREAVERGDRDAEARACHDLAGSLHHMNRGAEGAPLAFRAYQLYEDPIQRIRALSDTGQILKERGLYGPARKAFLAVIDQGPPPEIRLRTVVELVDLSAITGDRLSFERWRREVADSYERLPVDERVDFELKVGCGFAQFGRLVEGRKHLERALELAEKHSLPEWLFRAEALIKSEDQQQHRAGRSNAAPAVSPETSPELRATIEELEQLCVN